MTRRVNRRAVDHLTGKREVLYGYQGKQNQEEEIEHVMNERLPEDYETSQPQRQPEAKKSPNGLHKVLPLVIIVMGIIVAGIVILGLGNSGG